jgi:hypothetical protein
LQLQGIINLQTYSRPSILELCLDSISQSYESANLDKLIILQVGNPKVESLVNSFEHEAKSTTVIKVDGKNRSPLQNMNWNRWIAWQHGFEVMGADWILSIEEDVSLHPNTLVFVREIMELMQNQRDFKGINLGSKLHDVNLNGTFSKLRFGLHGCGAAITLKTWEEIKRLGVKNKIDDFPLDVCIEHILKSGFMVTPNLSHYLDYGWFQGTHTNPNSQDPQYREVLSSFNSNINGISGFVHKQVNHGWREDCVEYIKKDNLKFKFRKYLSILWTTHTFQNFYLFMRNYKRRIMRRPQVR